MNNDFPTPWARRYQRFSYEVKLKQHLHGLRLPSDKLGEIKKWLESNIGAEYVEWVWVLEIVKHGTIDIYAFETEENKVRFILKWL